MKEFVHDVSEVRRGEESAHCRSTSFGFCLLAAGECMSNAVRLAMNGRVRRLAGPVTIP